MSKECKLEFVTCLIVLTFLFPIYALIEYRSPTPTITIEASDEIDVAESLLISSESYTPTPIITVLNDTSVEGNNAWRASYSRDDLTLFQRFVNIPLRNITEVIIGASFNVTGESKEIRIYCEGTYNTTMSQTVQKLSLTIRPPLSSFWAYNHSGLTQRAVLRIEIQGDYTKSIPIPITGVWIQAVKNATLYPVSLDIQRTNGVSLYSNQVMRDIQLGSYSCPKIEFKLDDLIWFGAVYPTQTNDTILLPTGNFTLYFDWYSYQLNTTVYVPEAALHLVWRVKSVRVDVKLMYNIPGYKVIWSSHDYQLTESPSIILRSGGGNWSSTVWYPNGWTFASTSLGANRNITFWVNPNLVVLGPFAITPLKFILIVSLLTIICILGMTQIMRLSSSAKLIPFSFVVLSYILPWIHYTRPYYLGGSIPNEEYLRYYAINPGISCRTVSTVDSLLFVSHGPDMEFSLIAYLILFIPLIVVLYDILNESTRGINYVFGTSLFLIFIMEFFYGVYSSAYNWYADVTLGLGPYIVLFSVVMWSILLDGKKALNRVRFYSREKMEGG